MIVEEKWRCFCSCTCQNLPLPALCSTESRNIEHKKLVSLGDQSAWSSRRSIQRLNSLMAALTLWPSLCSLCLQLFLNGFTLSCSSCVSIMLNRTEVSVAVCLGVYSSDLIVPACAWLRLSQVSLPGKGKQHKSQVSKQWWAVHFTAHHWLCSWEYVSDSGKIVASGKAAFAGM